MKHIEIFICNSWFAGDMQAFKQHLKNHSKKFTIFFIIGILKSVLGVFLAWLFIDILHIWALLGSALVTTIVFFLTYVAYVITKVIQRDFFKYFYATLFFNLLTIVFIWIFVDFLGFTGLVSSLIVMAGLFILRYLFFNKIGLLTQ